MIVVIGPAALLDDGRALEIDGPAGRVARAAASAGATVELIAKIGDDPDGDSLLLALTRAGVGHVAILRDAVHPTTRRHSSPDSDDAVDDASIDGADEAVVDDAAPATARDTDPPGSGAPMLDPADVDLALRYLTDYRVVVAVDPAPAVVPVATAAAEWAGAHLVLVADGTAASEPTPPGSLVIETSGTDDAGLAERLGRYAASIDAGEPPERAYAALTADADGITGERTGSLPG